jgi:hypothetical protein
LESENQTYLEKILKHSKEAAGEVELSVGAKSYNNPPQDQMGDESGMEGAHGDSQQEHSHLGKAPGGGRNLSLKQLKELISEIYESKAKFDKKYAESKLPRETMEQHMYTFLNTKYGLKSLIIEWAGALINGIKRFNGEDNDVAVFGKILRNECDEEFKFVQAQVKTTIRELLKVIYYWVNRKKDADQREVPLQEQH